MEYFLANIKVSNGDAYYELVKVDTYEEAVEKVRKKLNAFSKLVEIEVSSAIE